MLAAAASRVLLHSQLHMRNGAAPQMDLTICTGGACTERGADLLYEATCVLSSADEKLWKARGGGVKTAFFLVSALPMVP